MKVRLQALVAACAAVLLVAPVVADAQVRVGAGVRVGGPRAVVRVSPRVYFGGYYRPYFYGSAFYGPWGWYGSPYWYGGYYPGYYPGYYGSPYGYYGGGSALRIEVKPKNAEVYVDGYYAGIVDDFDGVFQRLDLSPGEHDLELFLPGYRSVEQKIYLQPGNTFRVKYTMQPLRPGEAQPVRPTAPTPPPQGYPPQVNGPDEYPPQPPVPGAPPRRGAAQPMPPNAPPQPPAPPVPGEPPRAGAPAAGYGTLALRVQPPDADVMIDGERWTGAQPGERLEVQLSAGTHNVEIRKDGYRLYSTDVTIRNGQTSALNVALTRQ